MLADTWERLLAEAESATGREAQIDAARRAWSQGFVAEAVDSFCRKASRDDSGRNHAGVLTGEDMAQWSASYEPAVIIELGEWALAKCGPWSQGPVLAQQLLLLQGFAGELCYVDGMPTARTVHLATECAKLAFADREAWYGDSADVPLNELLSRGYTDERRRLVSERASMELRPGSPGGRSPKLPSYVAEGRGIGGGEPEIMSALGEPPVSRTGANHGDTVHLAGTGAVSAHHAVAIPGAAGRRAKPGVRHAGRRPAGRLAALLLVGAHGRGGEPAGCHLTRQPGTPQRFPARSTPVPGGRASW